jgi:hypothetical protein
MGDAVFLREFPLGSGGPTRDDFRTTHAGPDQNRWIISPKASPQRLLPKGLAKANVRKIRGKSSGPGLEDVLESNQATASRSRLAAPASGPTFSELPANPVPFSTPSFSHSPTQQKVASIARGRSKRVSAMTSKVITLEFVVPTVLALALGIVLSIGAVYLTDKYLVPIDQAEAHLPFHR